ncbi:MAG TPA: ricin-type beta-trefoil lectin domain protein [Trebonia sp.]|nr:ricin-type beta-trefoil lectin domain protein [Trebonia sp.]
MTGQLQVSGRSVRRASAALIVIAALAAAVGPTAYGSPAPGAGPRPAASASPIAGSARGVDISDFTAVTSSTWPDLRKAGITFVGVKASEGTYFKDSIYQPYTRAATAAGLYVMPYVFADPYQGDAARKIRGYGTGTTQAAYAWDNEIGAAKTTPAYHSSGLMLPVVLDIEADPYAGRGSQPNANECYGLSRPAMLTWISQFLAEMTALSGKTPIIYTAPDFWARCTGNYAGFGPAYPLWLADYGVSSPPAMPGWGSPTFWQYTSFGSVAGITGPVDLDYLGPIRQGSVLGTAVTPVQLQTLNALNAQGAGNGRAVRYSSQALPPGLSLSSSGLLTGTPTVAGAYRVTVTATGGVPATIAFTWDTPPLAPAREASTAGGPVSVQVRATAATADATDDAAGKHGGAAAGEQGGGQAGDPPPVLTARWLPAGLTMSPTGLITGWPYRPGRYLVRVSATSGSRVAASAWIAWRVWVAADSGTTGSIRQQGAAAKCLDDPSFRTVNGTPVDLATCTGQPNQAWTAVQDGTIRVLGRCLTASRAHLLIERCNSRSAEQWHAGTGGSIVSVRYGTCLAGPALSVADGTRPALAACADGGQATAQQWSRPAAAVVSGVAGRCLDAPGGGIAGSPAVLADCGQPAAERWSLTSSSEITALAGGDCLTAGDLAVTVAECLGTPAQQWSLVSAGHIPVRIKSAAYGLCLTAPAGSAVGIALVLGACSTGMNATWRVG